MSILFDQARRQLLAKMISELSWEEVLHPEGSETYRLPLASGETYHFQATRRIWDNLDIDPNSLSVESGKTLCPLRFTVDAKQELDMTPATHATFLRELSNTLRQDAEMLRLYGAASVDEMIGWPSNKLHAALNGHPKAVANKGRLGWGCADLDAYAPEYARPIQLSWLAVHRSLLRSGRSDSMNHHNLLDQAIGAATAQTLRQKARTAGASPEDHVLVPVHPWQLQAHLAQSFTVELSGGDIVDLGPHGPDFVATPSIRTLTPAKGGRFDVKLSLGILNTSAWRGMPGKYIEHGGAISDWLSRLVKDDPALAPCVTVLREVAGDWVRHPLIADCPDAPYRHHELLGALWRENADHLVGPNRRAVMASAFFHECACGTPLAVAFARQAGMPIEAWLQALFDVTVVPLWHMLCRYGVGFIAHGQNIIVILENDVPVGMAIKDFQGDLDLVDQDFPEMSGLDPKIRALLPRKPPAYIVHDIQTAHFITVLRFLSAALSRSGALPEDRFYGLLAETLHTYARKHPELAERQKMFDLFAPLMPKVCINRVRFAIGYEDSAERPLPARGTDLINPLASNKENAPFARRPVSAP